MTNCENFKIASNNLQSQSTNFSESGTVLPPISNRRNNDKDQTSSLHKPICNEWNSRRIRFKSV